MNVRNKVRLRTLNPGVGGRLGGRLALEGGPGRGGLGVGTWGLRRGGLGRGGFRVLTTQLSKKNVRIFNFFLVSVLTIAC